MNINIARTMGHSVFAWIPLYIILITSCLWNFLQIYYFLANFSCRVFLTGNPSNQINICIQAKFH